MIFDPDPYPATKDQGGGITLVRTAVNRFLLSYPSWMHWEIAVAAADSILYKEMLDRPVSFKI